MNRNDVTWRGYWAATVTPFHENGKLDESGLHDVVDLLVRRGVHGICVNGSTGEWFSQTIAERKRVAEVAVGAVAGRVPTVVAVTSSRVDEAIEMAQHAAGIGADSVMAAPPPLARPTTAELVAYYEQVFSATSLPAWLYNFPQDNGHPISVDELCMLVQLDNVVAIKQSSASLAELIETIERTGSTTRVFGNLLTNIGAAMVVSGFGGDGHFGSGMLLGSDMPRFFELLWDGRYDEAIEIAERFAELMRQIGGARDDGYNWAFGGMQSTLKAAMNILGEPAGFPRMPKLPISDPGALDAIRKIVVEMKLEPADVS